MLSGAGRDAFIQLRSGHSTVSRENLELEMRSLASPQLFCFGTFSSRHPAFTAELVQMSAEKGGLGKGSSGVCGLRNLGPYLKALLPK